MENTELFESIPTGRAVLSMSVPMIISQAITIVYNMEDTKRCVLDAISVGYRSIDTAQDYFNEEGVGEAVSTCGIPRDELFLTTKIWISNGGYEKAKASIDESIRKLKTGYIDLMLIHQPFNDCYGSYRAMEDAYRAGKIRAIGVSNFMPDRFIDIAGFVDVVPMVNQLEVHAFQQQRVAGEILKKYGTQLMAWSPPAQGLGGVPVGKRGME